MNTIEKDIITLGIGEELKFDVDDLMEVELREFHTKISNVPNEEILEFKNWIYIYKSLNYDIFEGLNVIDVFKINKYVAAIELSYNGSKEIDILNYIEDDGTVLVYNIRFDSKKPVIRQNTIRRILIPTEVDEALAFATRFIDSDDVKYISNIMNNILGESSSYRANKSTLKQMGIIVKSKAKNVGVNKNAEKPVNEPKKESVKTEFDVHAFIYDNILIGREDVAKEAIRHVIYKDVKDGAVKELMIEQYINYIKNSTK